MTTRLSTFLFQRTITKCIGFQLSTYLKYKSPTVANRKNNYIKLIQAISSPIHIMAVRASSLNSLSGSLQQLFGRPILGTFSPNFDIGVIFPIIGVIGVIVILASLGSIPDGLSEVGTKERIVEDFPARRQQHIWRDSEFDVDVGDEKVRKMLAEITGT